MNLKEIFFYAFWRDIVKYNLGIPYQQSYWQSNIRKIHRNRVENSWWLRSISKQVRENCQDILHEWFTTMDFIFTNLKKLNWKCMGYWRKFTITEFAGLGLFMICFCRYKFDLILPYFLLANNKTYTKSY